MKTDKRVMLIEPSPIVREGIKSIFSDINGYNLVDSYSDTNQLVERCKSNNVNMLIFNPLLMSFQHRSNIRNFFAIPDNIQLIALVYTLVDDLLLQQFDAIIHINDDASKITKKLQQVNNSLPESKQENEELTDRELEILISIVKGLTNKEIADKHFISIHTVISHRKNIVRKIGIKSVSGLTVYALLNNLISYEDVE
jgi:DNA-binding NarL/FixJ family response regulator